MRTRLNRGSALRASVLLGILFTIGCGKDPVAVAPVAGIVVTVDRGSLHPGDQASLTARLTDANGRVLTGREVHWATSDPERLAITGDDESAMAEALGVGEPVTVTASVGDITGSATIAIQPLFSSIEPAGIRTCALDPGGVAFCWGRYDSGPQIDLPKRVGGDQRFSVLAGGAIGPNATCGLTTMGAAYCWSTTGSGIPALVAGAPLFSSLSRSSVSSHRCALTAEGAAYCWGANRNGQIGIGVTGSGDAPPSAVAGDLVFSSIVVGSEHTCALLMSGAAFCWGQNSMGQLGDGTVLSRTTPVAVLTDLRFSQLAAGTRHTCGITVDGSGYCWGDGNSGALGDGSKTQHLVPSPVAGRGDFIDISAGALYTCGVTRDATGYCWGQNLPGGQLGSPGASERLAPYPIVGGYRFATLGAGASTTCGITVQGRAMCWGSGSNGQVGNGASAATTFEPAVVANPITP